MLSSPRKQPATHAIRCIILGSIVLGMGMQESIGKEPLSAKLTSHLRLAGKPLERPSESRAQYPRESRSKNWSLPVPQPRAPLRQRRMMDSLATIGPDREEGLVDSNLASVQQTMQHGDMKDPRQQAALQQEFQRLQQQKQQQAFQQRLQQRLNVRIGTPEDSDPQAAKAAFMARLMGQMRSQMRMPR